MRNNTRVLKVLQVGSNSRLKKTPAEFIGAIKIYTSSDVFGLKEEKFFLSVCIFIIFEKEKEERMSFIEFFECRNNYLIYYNLKR